MTSMDQSPSPYFSQTHKRAPSLGFSQSHSQQTSPFPWEAFVAQSTLNKSSECLLCGRISARNPWRTRAHFLGGDTHVQLCPQLSQEIMDFIKNCDMSTALERRKMTGLHISPSLRCSNSSNNSALPACEDMAFLDLSNSAKTPPSPSPSLPRTRCEPKPGFEVDKNEEGKQTWRANVAFNKAEGRAQCLLCNRVSKNNAARLKAHFLGGDKHVAVCPSVLQDNALVPTNPAAAVASELPTLLVKRAKLIHHHHVTATAATAVAVDREDGEEGYLSLLFAAADVVESSTALLDCV